MRISDWSSDVCSSDLLGDSSLLCACASIPRKRHRSGLGGMANSTITVAPIAGAIGAEIPGVDVSAALSDDSVAAIRRALLDHLVVFFRGQQLIPRQLMAFAGRFGAPAAHPLVKGLGQ